MGKMGTKVLAINVDRDKEGRRVYVDNNIERIDDLGIWNYRLRVLDHWVG